uniref:NADH-ubiquinone oxidoreductase chain 2 n=1 Tax=Hyalella franciscae TaxID=2759777 RepID=A0A7T8ZSH1_9CRUS|nr:NADH dehydrogenase subunit 2 [Hyalella franciscae]
MLMHPYLYLFYLFLMFAIFLIISANSWFVAWVGLEMNVISFIPLMLSKNNKYSNESSLKYFLTRAFASIFIISSALFMSCGYLTTGYLLLSALFLKAGGAPFHQWLPSLVEGLSWSSLMVIFILQKVSPLLLVSFLLLDEMGFVLGYLVIVTSAMIGSIGGLMSISLRKIMAYSSISHMSWVVSSMFISNFTWVGYYGVYCLVLFCVLNVFKKESVFSLNQMMLSSKSTRLIMSLGLLSLGGLPPFSGFVPKFMVSIMLLQNNNYFIFIILLSSTFLSLFFYVRMTLIGLILSSGVTVFLKESHLTKSGVTLNIMGLLVPGLFFLML